MTESKETVLERATQVTEDSAEMITKYVGYGDGREAYIRMKPDVTTDSLTTELQDVDGVEKALIEKIKGTAIHRIELTLERRRT